MYIFKNKVLIFFFVLLNIQSFAQTNPSNCSLMQLDSILKDFNQKEQLDKLMPYALAGVEKAAKERGKEDTIYARMLFFLGLAYDNVQDLEKAMFYCQQAIDIQKVKIPKHTDYANSLSIMGIFHFYNGNYALVEEYFKKTVALRKEILGIQHPDYAYSLNNLAILYKEVGAYSEAEKLYKETLEIYKKTLGFSHPEYSSGVNNLANLYADMGRYEEAESLYREVINAKKKIVGIKHPSYATSVNNLAVLYNDMGNYAEAEALNKEALAIRKEVLGKNHPDYAASLNNLANLYNTKKDYATSEALFHEAIDILKTIFGDKHIEYSNGLNNLANLYLKTERYSEAEKLYKESLAIRKSALGVQHPKYASSLNNLAVLYDRMNRYADSERLYKETVALKKQIWGMKHIEYIGAINNLSILYLNTKQYDKSWDLTLQSIHLNCSVYLDTLLQQNRLDSISNTSCISLEYLLFALKNVGVLLVAKKSSDLYAKQFRITELALKLLKKSKDDFSIEEDKLRILSQSEEWTLRGLQVLDTDEQVDLAFAFAEQNKSVLIMDAVRTERAYSMGNLPDSLIQEEEWLQKEHSALQAMLAEKRNPSEKDSLLNILNELNVQIKDFKKHIEKTYPQYAALKYEQKDASVQEIQQSLEPQTALLEYVVGDSIVYIFYIDSKNTKIFKLIIKHSDLIAKVKELHYSLSNYAFINKKAAAAYQTYTENAYWFYENLVQPALQVNKEIKKLIIIPDNELGHLPFEAFLVEQAPQSQTDYSKLHYLVEDFTISYNYSATLYFKELKPKTNRKPTSNGILALSANYEIPMDSTNLKFRLPVYQRLRKALKPLPSARKEVILLEENFQGFFAFDKTASEKTFKEKAPEYSIIHLAMHGLLDSKAPILSSLVFTEDGDSLENNFLHAYEISKLKLNADLVVLSACETGYGKFEKGNGIASLARAFVYAGASSLVVSLWQVNDYATSEIMKNFYKNLSDGMKKDEALKLAKTQYIKSANGLLAHPAFWSPFIQIGNNAPIFVKTKSAIPLGWGILGLSTLLVMVLAIWKKFQNK